jgi:ADP-ribosylglycohydrolase
VGTTTRNSLGSFRRAETGYAAAMKRAAAENCVASKANGSLMRISPFQHLLRGSGYEETIRATLAQGGDTDTNACIAGALVGAAEGASSIPETMKAAVLDCDTRKGRSRPEFLHGRRVPELVTGLLNARR